MLVHNKKTKRLNSGTNTSHRLIPFMLHVRVLVFGDIFLYEYYVMYMYLLDKSEQIGVHYLWV